jgi:hypothetical protein
MNFRAIRDRFMAGPDLPPEERSALIKGLALAIVLAFLWWPHEGFRVLASIGSLVVTAIVLGLLFLPVERWRLARRRVRSARRTS